MSYGLLRESSQAKSTFIKGELTHIRAWFQALLRPTQIKAPSLPVADYSLVRMRVTTLGIGSRV